MQTVCNYGGGDVKFMDRALALFCLLPPVFSPRVKNHYRLCRPLGNPKYNDIESQNFAIVEI